MIKPLLRTLLTRLFPLQYHGERHEPVVYLTFDDGPTTHTPRVLERLARHAVGATFFCVGNRIAGNEPILAEIHAAGHRIGNHSYSHRSARVLPYPELARDFDQCAQSIRAIVSGWNDRLLRPPYGDLSWGLLRLARQHDYRIVMWTRDAIDYRAASAAAAVANLAAIRAGDILLFHDESKVTPAALDIVIPNCLDRGLRFGLL